MSRRKDTFTLKSENRVINSQPIVTDLDRQKFIFFINDIVESLSNPQDTGIEEYTTSDKDIVADAMTKAIYDIDDSGIVDASSSNILTAFKGSPGTINPGELVYVSGENQVELVDNTFGTGAGAGVAVDIITDVASGRIMQLGLIENVDTSALVFGPIWLSAVPGQGTQIPPVAGEKNQIAGIVNKVDVLGSIIVAFSDVKNTDADFSIYNPGANVIITSTNVQAALDQIEAALAGGSSPYYDYNADEASTASAAAWTSKLVLSIPNLPIGNYEWKWTAEVNCTTNNRRVQVKFEESASIMNEIEIEPKDTNNWYAVGGFKNLPQVVAGPVTLEIFFKRSGNPATANCRRARISIKSV